MSDTPKALRILAVMSSPTILKRKSDKDPIQKIPRLEIENEWQALCKAVEGLPVRLERCYPPTLNQMDEMISRAASPEINAPYQVVHFSGHGDISNLLFEDGCLQGVLVKAERLGEIFKSSSVKLVILSACYSGVDSTSSGILSPAEVLAETYVPAVIYTNQEIIDDVARLFAKAFFSHMSARYSIKESFNYAQRQIENDPDIRGAQKTVFELKCANDFTLEKVSVEPGIVDPVPPQISGGYFKNPYFYGRDEELAEISVMLSEDICRPITITGIGGGGKSTLAREVAKRNAWRYPGGLVWVDFSGKESIEPGRLLTAVQKQLEVDIREGEDREKKIMSRLQSSPCLIVVDNAETIAVAARDSKNPYYQKSNAVIDMIKVIPANTQIICTSRELLGFLGEKEIKISSLDPYAALRLFVDVAKGKGRKFKIIVDANRNIEDKDKVDKVTQAISYLPLAVYLSASVWACRPGMTLEKLAEDLKKSSTKVLIDPSMTGKDAERQRSMVGTIQLSYNMLESHSAKELFSRLSVFAAGSGFDVSAVEEICGLDDWSTPLEELVRKSLVECKWLNDEYAHYWLFPPVQEFASGKLDKKNKKRLDKEFSQYYAQFSQYAHDLIRRQNDIKVGMALLDFEQDNLLKAFDLSLEKGWKNELDSILNGLDIFYRNRFSFQELSSILSKTLVFYQNKGNKVGVSISLQHMGWLEQAQDHYQQAEGYYQRSLEISDELGYKEGVATTLHQLGILAEDQNHYEAAGDYYRRSLEIKEELENKEGIAMTLHQMGILAHQQKHYKKAEDYYLRSLKISEELGNKIGVATTLLQLGALAQDQGNYKQAGDYYRRSLAIDDETGDKEGAAKTLDQLGRLAKDQGNYEQAGDYYRRSLEIKEQMGDKKGIAITFFLMGLLAQEQKHYEKAEYYYLRSLELRKKLENKLDLVATLCALGVCCEEQGIVEESLTFYISSLNLAIAFNVEDVVALTLQRLCEYIRTLGKDKFSCLWLSATKETLDEDDSKSLLAQVIELYEE